MDGLIGAMDDEDPNVRQYAAHALGEIGDPRAIDRLQAALSDEDKDVRVAAAGAIQEILNR